MEDSISLLKKIKDCFACKEQDINSYSPLTLAYIGDDVYDLILKYIEAIRPGRSDKRKIKQKSFVCFTYRVAA